MNTSSSSPFSLPETAPELARRFCAILAGLAGLVARRFVRMPHLARFTLLLWGRLNRAVPRFARALTATPAKPRARQARAAGGERTRPPGLPSGRGWLVRELGWEAAGYTSLMEALLAEPDTQAILAASPGLARILRPICRMLGVSVAATPHIVAVAPAVKPVWGRAADDRAGEDHGLGVAVKFLPG